MRHIVPPPQEVLGFRLITTVAHICTWLLPVANIARRCLRFGRESHMFRCFKMVVQGEGLVHCRMNVGVNILSFSTPLEDISTASAISHRSPGKALPLVTYFLERWLRTKFLNDGVESLEKGGQDESRCDNMYIYVCIWNRDKEHIKKEKKSRKNPRGGDVFAPFRVTKAQHWVKWSR